MFLFQREDSDGDRIYLWFHGEKQWWQLTNAFNFQERNPICFIYINSQGKRDLFTLICD